MHDFDNEIGPSRIISSGAGAPILLYILAPVVLLALIVGLWYIISPESMARVYGKLADKPLEIYNLALTVDGRPMDIPPDGSLDINPGQKFAIAGLNTNRWLNYDLMFFSPDINVADVLGGEAGTPAGLLKTGDFESPRLISINVLDVKAPVAVFRIISRYNSMDMATRGDAAADAAARADYYQKALNLDPGSKTVRDKLITALIESGQSGRAAEMLNEELARTGPEDEYLEKLLAVYTDQGLTEQRIEPLEQLITLDEAKGRPTEAHRRQLAELHRQGKRTDRAAEAIEQMMAQAPPEKAPEYLAELVELYRESGLTRREVATLKRLLEVTPPEQAAGIWSKIAAIEEKAGNQAGLIEAWTTLASLLPDGQDKANAYKTLAVRLFEDKKSDEARQAYETALKLDPKDETVLLNLARLALAGGDRAAYRRYLGQGIDLSPDNVAYRRELAEAYREEGNNGRAKTQYAEILKRTPGDESARLILLDLMEKTGDKKGLIREYGEMTAARPQDRVVAYNYAYLLYEAKQWKNAGEAFEKYLKLEPEDQDARKFLLVTYQNRKSNPEILTQAMELFRRDPSQTVYRTLMLNTCEIANDWESFARVAADIAKIQPNDPEIWQLLANAQTKLKKNNDAARSLYKAAEAAKDKVTLWLRAADALNAAKLPKEARQAYQKAQQLEPKNERAAKALLQLDLNSAQN